MAWGGTRRPALARPRNKGTRGAPGAARIRSRRTRGSDHVTRVQSHAGPITTRGSDHDARVRSRAGPITTRARSRHTAPRSRRAAPDHVARPPITTRGSDHVARDGWPRTGASGNRTAGGTAPPSRDDSTTEQETDSPGESAPASEHARLRPPIPARPNPPNTRDSDLRYPRARTLRYPRQSDRGCAAPVPPRPPAPGGGWPGPASGGAGRVSGIRTPPGRPGGAGVRIPDTAGIDCSQPLDLSP